MTVEKLVYRFYNKLVIMEKLEKRSLKLDGSHS